MDSGKGGTGGKEPDYTSRGRRLDAALPAPKKNVNPLGEPLMRRQRSNSLRRLPIEHLQALSDSHGDAHVRAGAAREMAVRRDLVAESRHQFTGHGAPRMNALGPVGMREVSAMRFASSMAEEAQDEVNREYSSPKEMRQVGQIGVASVRGHLGVGFSGTSGEMAHTRRVERRMLDLQQHYDAAGRSAHWSGRLQPVVVSDVFAPDDGNICAAKRAAHVAHSLADGTASSSQPRIERRLVSPPDSLIEMMSPAMSGRGNLLSDYSAARVRGASAAASGHAPTISARPRSASVDNMANSCPTCMHEHETHMKKRSDHTHS